MSTLKDIAQAAGVSLSTASRVLNGGKGISQKTCEEVLKTAKNLNYIPNLSAKILAGKNSKMIGIIVPEIDSDYFARLIFEIERQLQKHGYFLLIANTQYKPEKEIQALNTFCTYNVDGIFLTCTINEDILESFSSTLNAKNIPMILLDARLHTEDYSCITVDDAGAMEEAIKYLLNKGHQRIGFIGDYILDILRNEMYISALQKCGLDVKSNPIYSHPNCRFEQAGYETMMRILTMPDHPTAFLAGYDDIAIGALRAIHEAGLSVPDDIAIIGNDNVRESSYLQKSLTTLAPPVTKMAKLGTQIMFQSIQDGTRDVIHHVSLKPELIIRETA